MHVFNWLGVIIQASMFIFVIRARKAGSDFNPLCFCLWVLMSVVTLTITAFEKGNWLLPATWVICDSIIAIYLIRSGCKMKFGKMEKWVLGLTLLSLATFVALRLHGKGVLSLYVCLAALAVAIYPQIKDYRIKPESVDPLVWWLYTISNFFCLIGNPLKLENSLLPGASVPLCLVPLVLLWRYRRQQSLSTASLR